MDSFKLCSIGDPRGPYYYSSYEASMAPCRESHLIWLRFILPADMDSSPNLRTLLFFLCFLSSLLPSELKYKINLTEGVGFSVTALRLRTHRSAPHRPKSAKWLPPHQLPSRGPGKPPHIEDNTGEPLWIRQLHHKNIEQHLVCLAG